MGVFFWGGDDMSKRSLVFFALVLSIITCLETSQASDSQDQVIDLSKDTGLIHFVPGLGKIHVSPAFEDYSFMLEDVCNAMELSSDECLIYPMNAQLGRNAIATIIDGNRVIIYDRELSPILGYEGAIAVIAHELAHHYCGHLTKTPAMSHEYEADIFAGAAMKNAGFDLYAAMSFSVIFDERPSLFHPKKSDRMKAIMKGWEEPLVAKSCKENSK